MRRFQRGNDALDAATFTERRERFGVSDRNVIGTAAVLEPRVFGADAWVVESGRDRMRLDDLPVRILQQVGAIAVQHAWPAGGERRRMAPRFDAITRGLDPDQLDVAM